MTTDEKLEKIWESQKPDEYGHRHPVLYERCRTIGWRLYRRRCTGCLPDAIVTKGSPTLREAVDAAYEKLFPSSTGETS